MGFWDFMNRMVNGRPVFDNRDFRDEDGNPIPVDDDKVYPESHAYSPRPGYKVPVDSHGQKIRPELQIINSNAHESGERYIDLWVTIQNNSDRTLRLDSTDFLGFSQNITYQFVPGQQYQIEVYKGEMPNHGNYHYATLYYCDLMSRDSFASVHQILYHIEHDKYMPTRFQMIRPIKDT